MNGEVRPYRLIKEVTHHGVLLPAGASINADDRKAEWLHDQGVIVLPGRRLPQPQVRQQWAPQPAPRRSSGGCCGWR